MLIYSFFDLLKNDFSLFVAIFGALMATMTVGLSFHEFSHGAMAYWLGDRTAKAAGRLTLNPAAHFDPAGALCFFIVGFGWAKPVPFNPYYLRRFSQQTGLALVGAAGPGSNLLLAGVAALIMRTVLNPLAMNTSLDLYYPAVFLTYFVFFNVVLAVFNMIPLPPLDGFKVAVGTLPREMAYQLSQLEQYGPAVLMIVLFALPWIFHVNVLSGVMSPVVDRIVNALMGY